MADTNSWMTISEACDYLGITRQALYLAVKTGDIEKKMILGHPAVKRADVLKYKPRKKAASDEAER